MSFRIKAGMLGCAALFSAVAFNGIANAAWVWNATQSTDVAAIDYRGQQKNYEFPTYGSGGNVFGAIKAARNSLYYGLKTQFEAGVAATVQGKDGYRWHQTWVHGPIQFGIAPTPGNPHPTVSISQLSAGFKVHTKNKKHLIVVDCDIWMDSGPLNIAGKLDLSTGQVYDIRVLGLQPRYGRDCDSSVSWLPIIGNIIDNYVEGKVDKELEKMVAGVMAASQSSFQPVQFAGLNVSIPDGKYVFDGFDAGQYLRSNLATLIATANVTVRFDEPIIGGIGGTPAPDWGRRHEDKGVLWINFASQGLTFGLVERTYYEPVWRCFPGRPCGQMP